MIDLGNGGWWVLPTLSSLLGNGGRGGRGLGRAGGGGIRVHELNGGGVDAVALAGRFRTILEDVAHVGVAAGAADLGAYAFWMCD